MLGKNICANAAQSLIASRCFDSECRISPVVLILTLVGRRSGAVTPDQDERCERARATVEKCQAGGRRRQLHPLHSRPPLWRNQPRSETIAEFPTAAAAAAAAPPRQTPTRTDGDLTVSNTASHLGTRLNQTFVPRNRTKPGFVRFPVSPVSVRNQLDEI